MVETESEGEEKGKTERAWKTEIAKETGGNSKRNVLFDCPQTMYLHKENAKYCAISFYFRYKISFSLLCDMFYQHKPDIVQ